jgi:hypothetical protein
MPKPSLKLLYELTMKIQEVTESDMPVRVKRARLRPLYQEIDATEYALDTFPLNPELCNRCQDHRKTEENFNSLCDSCALFLLNHVHEFGQKTEMSEEEVAVTYAKLMDGLLKRGKVETKPSDGLGKTNMGGL